ncbi:hypothetical protein BGZ52_007104, partial [Haplosporangium bisporale]
AHANIAELDTFQSHQPQPTYGEYDIRCYERGDKGTQSRQCAFTTNPTLTATTASPAQESS